MFPQLIFAGLAELVNLAFHIFDVVNFVVAIFRQLRLFVRTQGRGFQLLVEIVDFLKGLFVGIGPIVEFFFRRILGVVNLLLGFLGLAVLFEGTVHVNGPNLERALAKRSQRQRQHGSEGKREQFLHKTMGLVVLRGVRPPW